MTIFLLIVVLLVVVLVHEWGHFIAARKSGMAVEEFGFGIPPRIWSWKKGETTYSINALPFGGFVKIAGENGIEDGSPLDKQFESKPWYKQSIVLVAGVICNILLAIFLFTISYSLGTPVLDPQGTPTVIHVTKDGPVDKSGIKPGDTIVELSKNNLVITDIDTQAFKDLINGSTDPISVTYVHNKETKVTSIVPEEKDNGVIVGIGVEKVSLEYSSIGQSFVRAVKKTISTSTEIFEVVGSLLGKLVTGQKQEQALIGPIGLATEIRNASDVGFGYLLGFTAMISVNLAVINILPFPALDGGRLIIVLLERIFRRKFSKKAVGIVHACGFILLIGLMIILSVGDVRRLF